MKKNLLCFLFLFTTVFYAQLPTTTMCFGENDLNIYKTQLIGNLDPAETTVSYHLSLADATNNANAIPNPSNYNPIISRTIYARIDNKGTITTNYFEIIVNPALNIAASNTPIMCKGDTSTLTITASGGSGQYSYSINGGAYTPTTIFTNLSAGIHTIQAVDEVTGCLTTLTYTITEPTSSLNTTAAIIAQTATITAIGGTAPYQYSINNGIYQPSNFFSNLTPGSNLFEVRDSQGCRAAVPATVLPVLTSVASVMKPLDCISNASVTITATGGQAPYTYSINGGAFQASNTFNNLTAGVYSARVKDALNSTSSTSVVVIDQPVAVNGVFTSINPTSCSSGTITFTALSGQAPYYYSIDNGASYSNMNTFTNLQAGNYVAFIKDSKGCRSPALFITIDQAQPLTLAIAVTNVNCQGSNDGVITINTTGGTAPYTYSIGNGYATTSTFNNLSAGNYYISVKDALGCITTMAAVIAPPIPISMTAIIENSTTSADNDGAITINATGGTAPYSYTLQNNSGFFIPNQTSPIFTGLKAGLYDVQVIDAKGCLNRQTITILNNSSSLVATATITQITCTNPTGTITVTATGGATPYQYSIDNGINYVSTNVFTGLTPGTYNIHVRDAVYTTETTITAVLTSINPPTITGTLISNITCKGNSTGSIVVNTTGGATPYYYSLDNGPYIIAVGNNMTFTDLRAGTHNIKVKDANQCLATAQVAVSEPVSALITEATIKNQTITINVTGGTGTYKYAISPDLDKFIMNNVFSELIPDSYTINISDENGCYNTINVLVDPSAPTIDGQINLTLPFKPGQTLANLIVNGKNIKWYLNPHPLTGKTSRISVTPLPLTTVLVDGTTYYASQTINGIESTERMAVTVKAGALGTVDFVIKDFTFYPNPVKGILTISNTSVIDEVTFMSIKGETLLTKQINSLRSEIDLSTFSNGIYLLKVKSEGTEKTVKLIKE